MTQRSAQPDQPSHIGRDIDRLDSAWEWIAIPLPVIAAAGSAWIQPTVDIENGWVGIFLSTLAFSLGCAFAVYLLRASDLAGWPLATAVAMGFLAAMFIAAWAGMGTLDPMAVQANAGGSSPVHFLLGVVVTASQSFGVVGAFLGGGTGAYLGYVAAKHLT